MNKGPKIIEMVGIGGAGKSSLRNLLTQKNNKIRSLQIPNKIRYLPFFAKVTFTWIPLYIQKYRQDRWFTLEETRIMGRLDEWFRYIKAQPTLKNQAVMLDPGSVFWLSNLREFGPAITKSPSYLRWWESKLDQWSAALDVIIWLDAPDDLLLKRVIPREEWHEAQDQTPELAIEYFGRYRAWYERLVPEMIKRSPIKMFRFRTDQISTEEMANKILSEIDLTN